MSLRLIVLLFLVISAASLVMNMIHVQRVKSKRRFEYLFKNRSFTTPPTFAFPICVPYSQRPNNTSYLDNLIASIPSQPKAGLLIVDVDHSCTHPQCTPLPSHLKTQAKCTNIEKIECVVQQAAYDIIGMLTLCKQTFPKSL